MIIMNEENNKGRKHIQIHATTEKLLKEFGHFGETWNDLFIRLCDEISALREQVGGGEMGAIYSDLDIKFKPFKKDE